MHGKVLGVALHVGGSSPRSPSVSPARSALPASHRAGIMTHVREGNPTNPLPEPGKLLADPVLVTMERDIARGGAVTGEGAALSLAAAHQYRSRRHPAV
uniref:Uncharacterized protein n=1 Tax=Pyxicephalus adspersus TaxID=30357 RepID=A0AAV3A4U3_PYXAD|nr:TPA: hypothetical protein GDO54_010357 [Pyxicephalus adspersus]